MFVRAAIDGTHTNSFVHTSFLVSIIRFRHFIDEGASI